MYTDQEYWDVMPEWMREGYHKEVIIFQVIQSAMAANLPPSELVSKCGEFLLRRYVELQKEMIDRAMMNPCPIVVCHSPEPTDSDLRKQNEPLNPS